MDKLGVVLVHDFFVNQGRIFCLLDEEFLEEQQLHAQQSSEEYGGDEGDGWTRISGARGEEQPVDEDVARREESEEFEVERLGVPDADLPYIVVLIRVSSRKDIVGRDDGREVCERRGGG